MPRKPRVPIVGVAEHIIQRGNNRQVISAQNGEMKALTKLLDVTFAKIKKSLRTSINCQNGRFRISELCINLSIKN